MKFTESSILYSTIVIVNCSSNTKVSSTRDITVGSQQQLFQGNGSIFLREKKGQAAFNFKGMEAQNREVKRPTSE